MKKSLRVATSNPKKLFGSPPVGNNAARLPANILDAALLMNHTPISKVANLAGLNWFTIDIPIGDNDNSPNV